MIKNNQSIVEVTKRNIKYYSKKFQCVVGEFLAIHIDNLPKHSHNKVIAICEICQSESIISFSKYNINKNRLGFYSCIKCSNIKRKKTNKEKYGVEHVLQRVDIRENNRKWMSSSEFKEKSIKKQIETYGCLYSETEQFRKYISDKTKSYISEKKKNGEYFCFFSSSENNILKQIGMYKKYGQTFSLHVNEIKEKVQNSNLSKFGHVSPFGNKNIQDRIKEKMIEKYGFDNPFKCPLIQKRINDKVSEKLKSIDIELFKNYKKLVRRYTDRNRKKLYESWDGKDYYDNEYIKNYLELKSNDSRYPTIDHKISCIYGFENNISAFEISRIENLCVTKRTINSKKSHLNEEEFLRIIQSN